MAFIGEKHFHKTPSGIDNITTLLGGMIVFENFEKYEEIQIQNLKMFQEIDLYLVDTKERRETSKFIEIVTKFKNEYPKIFLNAIDSIKEISKEMEKLLYENNKERLNKLINMNQSFLEIIQVSNSTIGDLI